MSFRFLNLWTLVLCLVSAPRAFAGSPQLAQQLDTIIDQHVTAKRTTVTLKVLDVATGEVLYDRDGDRLLTPASNLKIYTSACALDLFGPEHKFETVVRAAGPVTDGVLAGNLTIIGGGDSMLSSGDLEKIADRVIKEFGIKEIQGVVKVDNSRYSSPLKGPGWMWDDDPEYYNMSVTPLMVDFNVLELKLTPQGKSFSAELTLPTAYPPLKKVAAKALPPKVLAMRRPFKHPILVAKRGTLAKEEKLRISALNPSAWVAGVFSKMLLDRGVTFSDPVDGDASEATNKSREIRYVGVTLAETITHLNHESENAVAEVLLHEIAIHQGTHTPKWVDGASEISKWLVENAELEKDSFRLVDGSGLSRYDLISPDSSVRLLKFMNDHEHAKVFYDSLKPYEVEIDGEKRHIVAAKPGGMGGVSTISGYLTTLDGRKLAFSLLANGYIGPAEPVFDLRKQVWLALAKWHK